MYVNLKVNSEHLWHSRVSWGAIRSQYSLLLWLKISYFFSNYNLKWLGCIVHEIMATIVTINTR
jgi:hypothetical protein